MIRHLHREQFIPAEPKPVWAFFATPVNLNQRTPPDLRFELVGEVPVILFAGQVIRDRISPLPAVWLNEVAEIFNN